MHGAFTVFHLCQFWLQHRYCSSVWVVWISYHCVDTSHDLKKFKHPSVLLELLLQKEWLNLVALLAFQAVVHKRLVVSLFLVSYGKSVSS